MRASLLVFAVVMGIGAAGAAQSPRTERPLVMIDPGHGGTNTGAPGTEVDVYEKRFTAALARRLEAALVARGADVILTRETDRYLTLRQRVAMANQLQADVFVSLHGNATRTHTQRGYETYVLTPRAIEVDGRALRQADGAPRPDLDPELALLLDDVERVAAQAPAAALAARIQAALRRVRGASGDRGVRQESMDVLLGATMPAVLVEVGFIDHPSEGRELLEPTVQAAIAAALATAIADSLELPPPG